MLTFKVVALVALAIASRAQTLNAMSLDNMFVEKDCIVFAFTEFSGGLKTRAFFFLKS